MFHPFEVSRGNWKGLQTNCLVSLLTDGWNSAEHGYDSTDDQYSAEEGRAKRAKLQIKNDEELATQA